MTATPRSRGRRPVPVVPIPVKTVLVAVLAAVISALGLLPGAASAALARTAGRAAAAPSGASSLWPANPDWQRYVPAPPNRDVHPVSVVSTSGQVTGADALTRPGGNVR